MVAERSWRRRSGLGRGSTRVSTGVRWREDPWRTCELFQMAEIQDSAEGGEAREEDEDIERACTGYIWHAKEPGTF